LFCLFLLLIILKGALINFASNQNQEIKILLITCNGNDIVCKIPSDQNKFLGALRQIVQRQKQQQQQQQAAVQQQQQQAAVQQQQQQQHRVYIFLNL
jgi:hypothetical protein